MRSYLILKSYDYVLYKILVCTFKSSAVTNTGTVFLIQYSSNIIINDFHSKILTLYENPMLDNKFFIYFYHIF